MGLNARRARNRGQLALGQPQEGGSCNTTNQNPATS